MGTRLGARSRAWRRLRRAPELEVVFLYQSYVIPGRKIHVDADRPSVPIIAISTITMYTTLHTHNPRTPLLAGIASMDWLGTTTILAAAVLLLVGLQLGCATSYVTPVILALIVFGCILHFLFPVTQWWQERRGREPVLPLRIFKDVRNLCALGVCACDALAFNSVAYFLPLYLQIVLGRSPSMTGVYMLAIAVPLATVSFASGYLIDKTGRFLEVLQAGLLFMTIGVGLLISLDTTQQNSKLILIMFVIGLGFGPNFGAPLIALQTRIQESDIATGTAAFGFVRMIFGALGVVVGQVIFQLLMAPHYGGFIKAGIMPDVAYQLSRGEAISRARLVSVLPSDQSLVIKTSLSSALRGTWIFYTVISALGLLVSFGIKRTKLHRAANPEASARTLDNKSAADKAPASSNQDQQV